MPQTIIEAAGYDPRDAKSYTFRISALLLVIVLLGARCREKSNIYAGQVSQCMTACHGSAIVRSDAGCLANTVSECLCVRNQGDP
jgi:hypothetical protein